MAEELVGKHMEKGSMGENTIDKSEAFIKAVEYFVNNNDDILLISDSHGKIINEITREQVAEIIRYKLTATLDYDYKKLGLSALIKQQVSEVLKSKNIRMFLTDCDGCLTDGGMYYSENGDELKKFNTKDGMGFSFLRKRGIITGIITGEDVQLNRRRADKLKLDILEAGCTDKLTTVKRLCETYGITLDEVVYIGDDVNDLDVIKSVGFGCCPANAVSEVLQAAKYITTAKGGEGVIREVIELL